MKGTAMPTKTTKATAAFLSKLLNQLPPQGRYRERWLSGADKTRVGEINQAAVARVLTEHLVSKGRPAPESRQLRSLVSRALSGESLTGETLTLFIEAFAMTEADALKLQLLFDGVNLAGIETAASQTGQSRAFQKAVEDVEALIRKSFPGSKRGETRSLAERIVTLLLK